MEWVKTLGLSISVLHIKDFIVVLVVYTRSALNRNPTAIINVTLMRMDGVDLCSSLTQNRLNGFRRIKKLSLSIVYYRE